MSETSTHPTYPERLRRVRKQSQTLASAQPAAMEAFERFHQLAGASGALDRKTKELIALAISVTAGCDDCIAHHVHDAMQAGARRNPTRGCQGTAHGFRDAPPLLPSRDQEQEGSARAANDRKGEEKSEDDVLDHEKSVHDGNGASEPDLTSHR